jgi:toxin FitB
MYILNTNVISQFAKRQPNPGVVSFFKQAHRKQSPLFLSALTIGEIRKGIVKLTRFRDHQLRVSTLPDGLKSTLIDGCKRSGDFLLI